MKAILFFWFVLAFAFIWAAEKMGVDTLSFGYVVTWAGIVSAIINYQLQAARIKGSSLLPGLFAVSWYLISLVYVFACGAFNLDAGAWQLFAFTGVSAAAVCAQVHVWMKNGRKEAADSAALA